MMVTEQHNRLEFRQKVLFALCRNLLPFAVIPLFSQNGLDNPWERQ